MTDTSSRLDDRQWAALQQALTQVAARVPGWTNVRDGDPGVTLLELSAALVEELLKRGAIPERGLPAAARIEDALSSLPWRTEPEVRVDGEPWRFVRSLEEASADDRAFSVDRESGAVVFGDGARGRRPAEGSRVTARYRPGGSDATITLRGTWPLPSCGRTVPVGVDVGDGEDPVPAGGLVVGEGWSGLARVRYVAGRLLTAADLHDEQEYHLRKRRLHVSAVHGLGVVRGLQVEDTTDGTVVVSPGFAVDGQGREIAVTENVRLAVSTEAASPAWIVLAYAERPRDPAPVSGSRSSEATRIEEGFRMIVSHDGSSDGVPLARLARTQKGWQVDRSFRPPGARGA